MIPGHGVIAMEPTSNDARFTGSVPELYDRLLVPMLFSEAAERLADTIAARRPDRILETAAGTGVLTQAMSRRCPEARITATDLNQPMLDRAAIRLTGERHVTREQGDAQHLRFDDGSFDVVACQFGVMFFPDKVRAYAEARRVLRPGGGFVFSTWDRIEANEIADIITRALVRACPDEPLLFMSRTPHGYFDTERIRAQVDQVGFAGVQIETVEASCRTTAADAAIAFCQGTPLRGEIETHGVLTLDAATQIAQDALVEHYDTGPIAARIRWISVVADTPT